MYKHILMTTDLLDWNHEVENKVAEMQKSTGAKLSIMHVIEPLPAAYMAGDYGAIPGYRNIGEAWSNNVQDSLRKISDRIGVAATLSGGAGLGCLIALVFSRVFFRNGAR